MAIIEVKNLHKVYQESTIPVHAVNGIDLSIEKGEFTAVVGPSGSGKTTFLNLVGGLDSPTEGEIKIDGTCLSKLKAKQLIDYRLNNIGFVFQEFVF